MIETDTPLLTSPDTAQLYRDALEMLNRCGVPYMVGGTYALTDSGYELLSGAGDIDLA